MQQEHISVESEPEYIVALGHGNELPDLLERSTYTYTSARQPPLPRARPFVIGHAVLQPLFDRVLGRNHLIKGRYEAGTVSAPHVHNADQYLVIVGGAGTVSNADETHELRPGMVVWIPAGQRHVHSAAPDAPLEYILLTATGHTSTVVE
ncbi:MAG TPA: cupin domain-containing protein [Tepidiformaceae bacterium]|nr:cupin domain-containing protein [Tepidiformaceae bacterium]